MFKRFLLWLLDLRRIFVVKKIFKFLKIIAFPFIWIWNTVTRDMKPETQEERATLGCW